VRSALSIKLLLCIVASISGARLRKRRSWIWATQNASNYADGFFVWRDANLPVDAPDYATSYMLFKLPQQATKNVWSAIGATAPPSYKNSGHNNNLSFIITEDGVVVMNASDNSLLAKALHEEIKKITNQPVKYVVLENTQGHTMSGSNYWQGRR
jgi:hypothetical protein